MGKRSRRVAAWTSAAALAVGLLVQGSPPAGATTANENFVIAAYNDFMLRDPSSAELAWWSAYLGSGTRSYVLDDILSSTEFANLWAVGARYYYLREVDLSDPQLATDVSNLDSTEDFVAAEVSVVAGATYFANAGGTNTAYVQALYQDVFLRAADTPGLTYWAGRLDAATSTRSSVANYFIRNSEAANRRVAGPSGGTSCTTTQLSDIDSLAAGSFCIVLDRMADAPSATYWAGQLTATDQLPDLWISLAASSEYFTNAQ